MGARQAGVVLVLWLSVSVAMVGAAQPPAFTTKPTAAAEGDGLRIRFAVDRPTDVAVSIEDGKGVVVRHLVAGVLGKNPPPPLRRDSLAQDLVWDGRDDLGAPVPRARGPFRVRVSAGLAPTFDRTVGNNPRDLGGVRALAVGPDGNVYVFHTYASHHPNDGTTGCAVFSRQGPYLRTIVPYPADMPDASLKGLRTVLREDGSRSPFVYQFETRSFIPGLGDLPSQRAVVTDDGRLAFVGVQEGPRCFAQPGEARLTVIHTDGGVPAEGVLKTLISPLTDTAATLALSPDQKTLYATGIRVGTHPTGPDALFVCNTCDHAGATWRHTLPTHAVYQFGWNDVQVQEFVGDPARPGSGERELNEPVGVATDGDGNVYVADLGNNRIAVFGSDGSPLARIAVEKPQRVEVHRKTGAIYVLAGDPVPNLIKFDGYKTGREVARLALSGARRGSTPTRRPVIALDDRTDPPLIWLSWPLLRIADRGDSFQVLGDVRDPAVMGEPAMAAVMEMSLDRQRGWLYVNNARRYDVKTWTWESVAVGGGRMWPNSSPGSVSGSVGRDGNYYVHMGARAGRVFRYGPDLRPVPFPLGEKGDGGAAGYAKDHSQGHTADARGNVYVLWKKLPPEEGDAHRAYCLTVYNPDGTPKREKLINASVPGLHSVRVDGAGNIYLAAGLRPGTDLLPPGFTSGVRATKEDPDAVNRVNAYPMIYGSIVKFTPEGGTVREGAGGVRCNYGDGRPIDVKGAEWIVPGASVVASWATPKRDPGTLITCFCESPCIDVDDFGRTFFPDAGRSRVGVIDTAGNTVTWLGVYGNPDSAGPDSAIPGPEIPLCWPQAVAVGDRAVYIGDRLNRRIVVAGLAYLAEETCTVP